MRTQPAGGPDGLPPAAAPGGRRERLEQWSAGVPFRLKLALVWLGIFAVFALLFWGSKFDTTWMRDNAVFIVKGIWVTIFIAVCAIAGAIVLALLGALGRLSKNPVAFGVTGFYTSFFRGTPLIVQLFLIYLALPQLGQNLATQFRDPYREWITNVTLLSPVMAGIVGLSLNYGAYMTEIFRAGIQSVSHGQAEAAEALGMTYRQKMRRVVLPQAFRVIVPPTGNEFIAMMKDTALLSFLGAVIFWSDPFRRAQLLGKADFKNLEALLVAAGCYWLLTAIFTFFQQRLERRLSRGYVRAVVTPAGLRRRPGAGPVTQTVMGGGGGGPGGGARGGLGYTIEVEEEPGPGSGEEP
jgi:polar amino acid transport system permease protein